MTIGTRRASKGFPEIDSVSVMKTLDLQIDTTVETISYYTGWSAANDHPKGGATYNIVTLANYTLITSNLIPDEYGDHTLDNGNIAMILRLTPSNVLQWGAKGDGVTDDTASIQAVLNASIHVFFPDNIYMINAVSGGLIPNSDTLMDLSREAELKAITNSAASYTILSLGINAVVGGDAGSRSNIVVQGGKITGDKYDHTGSTGEKGHCIYLRNSRNITISGVTITKAWGDGIYISNSQGTYRGQDTSPRNCKVINCTIKDNSRNNISLICCDGLLIEGNEIATADRKAPMAGIDIEPTEQDLLFVPLVPRDVRIVNNEIHDNGAAGIEIPIAGTDGYDGIIISNNSIHGNSVHGIVASGSSSINHGLLIDGNTIRNNTGNQIWLKGHDLIKCTNNYIFKGVDNGTYGSGILIGDSGANAHIISGNFINEMPRHGIIVDGGAGNNVDHITIEGNYINGCSQLTDSIYNGIDISGAQTHYIHVIGNHITEDALNNLTNGQAYGIKSVDSNQHYIFNNIVEAGGKIANISTSGIRTSTLLDKRVFKGNQGFVTDTAIESDTFIVGTTGTKTITTAHGLAYTPPASQIQISAIKNVLTVSNLNMTIFVDSVDATNIVCIAQITTASGNPSDTMKLAINIPSTNS